MFAINEIRRANALLPLSTFRIKGLAAADITQAIASAGFISMFFFLTLYMQNVLHYSPLATGLAYLPVTAGVGITAGITSKLLARAGTRSVIVADSLIAAGGVYYLSRIPVHGSYLTDLLPGLAVMSIGLGALLTSGFQRALPASSIFLVAAAVIATITSNTRGEREHGVASLQPRPEIQVGVAA